MFAKCCAFALCSLFLAPATAQPAAKTADNAFLITRMAAKFHVQPRTLDPAFSADFFKTLLADLDDEKLIFTQADVDRLSAWRLQLADQVQKKKTDFLQLLIGLYQSRLLQLDTMAARALKAPVAFSAAETYTAREDTSFAVDDAARYSKLRKQLKLEVMNEILPFVKTVQGSIKLPKNKDSLEASARKKIGNTFKRKIQRIQIHQDGITGYVCGEYCSALAKCFDPHTAYFSRQENEELREELGDKRMVFGLSIKPAKEGVSIGKLSPGSPAYKSGLLNEGDEIDSLQWENKEAIDVSDASVGEVNSILSAENHAGITMVVRKSDGSTRRVTLRKEKTEDDEEIGKVKSFVLKGPNTIGFISLPAFYTDWEDKSNETGGCANDIAKEIIKLKKEHIEALIIDLRYNGGGSMSEGVGLSGLFIDAGPVAMLKAKEDKVYTLKDVNRGTIYGGPLILMINGYSASASEMVAGTLQDYNRALIVGSPSYGKATAQVVLPLDTLIDRNKSTKGVLADSYLKLTIEKLFRVSGNTAQEKGVVPDILIPDLTEASDRREAAEPFALPASTIAPNKYFQADPALPVSALQGYARSITDTSAYFSGLKKYIAESKKAKAQKDIPLQLDALMKLREEEDADDEDETEVVKTNAPFSVQYHAYEAERMNTDPDLRDLNDRWRRALQNDNAIGLCYLLAVKMIK